MTDDRPVRHDEKENLRHIIQQWNSNRLDLFEISEPDETLEFHGVMRFYFQDSGQKVATKCIRVSSIANTRHVIETLIEKFRPDMRMLSIPEYTLYEIHENGDERRLTEDEKPLLVQLNWNKDDREGRFLLRRMDMNGVMKMKTLPPVLSTPQPPATEEPFIRKLSRREKKELKKQEKIRRANENDASNSVAEKLYTELPETSFTRSISNPEAVMRRRRAQKLEKKLQQFRSKDGGPDTGGTLKIYGESLCQDVPYKTLLLSVRDSAAGVVREMLEKYGLYREDPSSYCLVQCIVTPEETVDGYQGKIVPQKEIILDEDECPLAILMNHPPSRGSIMFQVRRRPADHGQRRRKKKNLKGVGSPVSNVPQQRHPMEDVLPILVELGPDLSEVGKGRHHQLHLNVTEVGSDRSSHTGVQSLQLFGPHIQPRHCVIAHTDGIVTVTPCSRGAETFVNFQRIYETTILQHGSIVRFGRTHTFRFMDPQSDDRVRMHLSSPQPMHHHPQFMERNNYERFVGPPRDPILPAVLEFREEAEDAFLHNIITQLDPTDIQLKLAPTYTLYMAARFRASTHYRPDLSPTERAQKLTIMLTKVASIVHDVIEFKQRDPTALSFWMANASELLHFLKQDRHICGYSLDAQDILAEAVQFAFRKLVEYMQTELSSAMPVFLEDRDDSDEEEGTTAHVLSLLTNTMALLRRCRVNAALTIQLFSQLFHYINMWVFNKVVMENCPNYCTRVWGERIKERLGRVELWAEKQGLELSADCYMAKLSQAALLLIAPKSSPEDAANLSSTCFKLNSLQLRELLEKYQPAAGEPSVPKELIDNVVSVAETTADGLAREDGREVRLEEDGDLQLQFLLPQDGYSCDIVRGVPSGLPEFLEPLERAQLCRMTPQPTSSGFWTIYMHNHQELQGQRPPPGPRSPSAMSNRSITVPRGEPEIHTIELQKFNNGMGLSIVATKGENQAQLGIYIKSVVPGGAADQDGRLQAGDQLLSVDGKSLVGISQEEAAQYMVGTGSVVTLEVARQGALYHGLAPLLSQPSPQVTRVDIRRASNPRLKERFLTDTIPEVYNERLVEWDHTPIRPPLEQRPPLPPPSNTTLRPAQATLPTSPPVIIPSVREGPSAFSIPPRKTSPSMMVMSRSSPNLSVGSPSGTPSGQPRRQTPPLYSDTNKRETDLTTKGRLSALNASMPSLGVVATFPKEFEATNAPPLHPKPLRSVIPTETVFTGIRHRGIEETKENPDLPKYTFVPSNDSSPSSGSVCRWRWEERHRCSGHGAGCLPSCRRSSGPPNTGASGDSGIDLTCQACDGKLWRSMSNICDYELISSPSSSISQSCAIIPPPLPPKGQQRPAKILGPHYSCPFIHPKVQKKPSDAENSSSSSSFQRPLTPISKTRSSPNLSHLLLHSPPDSSSPHSSSSPHISSPSSAPHIGIQDQRREPPQHGSGQVPSQPQTHTLPQQHLPQQPHYPHHPQQSRMQASKSVPSLNSDFHHSPTKSNSHEVFNPSYSRTSSSTSLTQQQPQHPQHPQHPHSHQQYPVRSRSTQNLNESSALTLTGRHPSSPALNSEDDRHYQNISFHQGPQDPRMGSQRGGRPPIFSPQAHIGGQDQPRPTSAFMHREEAAVGRSEALHRPTSQQNLRPDMRYGQEDPRKRPNGLPLPQHATHMGGGYQPNQGMPSSNPPVQRQQYPRGHPKYNYQYGGGPPPQMSPHAHPGQMSPQGYYAPTSPTSPQGIPPQPMSPQYANSPQSSSISGRHPPPTAPKPNRNSGSYGQEPAPEKPMRQSDGLSGKPNGPPRPPLPEEGYRDSPPPPPPPTSTHPLMQPGSRSITSSGSASGVFGKPQAGIKGPWDRDEKEKYETRKREAARRWRDEQISALENLGSKTPQEEERMNTLKLEREFQRRAEEQLREGDDDEDEDLEEDDMDPSPRVEDTVSSSSRPPNGNVGETQEEDRDKRADEIRRKQRELEAAKEAEERLLREAQRRQEEELLRRHHHQQQQQRHQTQATQRLDSLVGAPHNANGMMSSNPRQNYGEHHPPSISPLPPERGSSYSVMHHHQTLESRHSDGPLRSRPQDAAPIKRVQFSETSSVEPRITYDNNANHEKLSAAEDPDDFINEAELLMNSSPNRGTGNTPGVIGAQEVYRDPRQRRLMEQAQKAAASRGPGPEKLTFREKMKMFAMEAEEGEDPKDKLKHSRAQREIEHGAS